MKQNQSQNCLFTWFLKVLEMKNFKLLKILLKFRFNTCLQKQKRKKNETILKIPDKL